MKKILGMGNALLDILVALPGDSLLSELGLAKGSMQLVDFAFSERVLKTVENLDFSLVSGGSASNTIHGLAKLGVETAFIGKVSEDEFGDIFRKDMQNSGIIPLLFKDEPQTGRAIALISPDSERTFATYLGSAVKLAAEELTVDLFKGYDIFHVEGYLVQAERGIFLADVLQFCDIHSSGPPNIMRCIWSSCALGGMAMPRSLSPSSSRTSPGLIPKISLACFGITIWPFSPTVAVQANFPSGRLSSGSLAIKSSGMNMGLSFEKYDLYN